MIVRAWACFFAALVAGPVYAGFDVVVLSGDASPDTGTFLEFGLPALSDTGYVAFNASLSGVPLSSDTGMFRGTASGDVVQIAREGAFTPDEDALFDDFLSVRPLVNNTGRVAFNQTFTGSGRGIYRSASDPTMLVQIARSGQIAPDGNGTLVLSNPTRISLNDAGLVTFWSDHFGTVLNPALDTGGVYRGGGTVLTQVARSNPAGPYERVMSGGNMNEAGQVVFKVNDGGIAVDDGTSGGVVIQDMNTPHGLLINNAGQVAYRIDGQAVYRDTTIVASQGDAAPDGNGTLSIGWSGVAINNAGQLAFGATGASGGDKLILRGDGVQPLLQVARTGAPLPGDDGVFVSFPSSAPALNDAGQMAFYADVALEKGGGGYDFGEGIYFYDDTRGLVEVISSGEAFLGDTIASLSFTTVAEFDIGNGPNSTEEGSGFNALGQVAFGFSLDNGTSGIAIWSPSLSLTGDLNGDGFVGQDDLNIVLGVWGTNVTPGDPLAGDPSGDGFVGQDDLNDVLAGWGQGTPPSLTAVPEPGSLAILLLGAAVGRRRGRGVHGHRQACVNRELMPI